jgi:hypothetical protein
VMKNSLISSTKPATHFASFHSTPTSCQKWNNKWKSVSLLSVFYSFSRSIFFFPKRNGVWRIAQMVKVCIFVWI